MIKNKLILTVFSLLLLYGCSSSLPTTRNYYILSNSQKSQSSLIAGEPVLLIRSVRLPDYLNEKGISQILDDGRVSISQIDLWAEPFSESLPRILAKEIEANIEKPVIVNPIPPGYKIPNILEVNINQLIANQDKLIIDAKYRLIKANTLDTHNFYRIYPLKDQSETALVEAHNKAVQELSIDIAKHYNKD